MENELIKLDFLKLDLLNSDRGYSTDNYSTYSEDAPSPSLSSSTQSRDKSEVDFKRFLHTVVDLVTPPYGSPDKLMKHSLFELPIVPEFPCQCCSLRSLFLFQLNFFY